jgi:hypothetical protein
MKIISMPNEGDYNSCMQQQVYLHFTVFADSNSIIDITPSDFSKV